MVKRKVIVEFVFECDAEKTMEEQYECIREQIETDLNYYYQNDDDTAQMTELKVKAKWEVSKTE